MTSPEQDAPHLSFDIVIATRNRPEALAISIPLILGQDRLPDRLIVIDSSDDHAPVAATVARAVQGFGGEVIVEHSEKGLTRQRNVGLRHVAADVVMFPDDDSLWHPGTASAIMQAYERDPRVAGVCAADATEPPPGALPEGAYAMTRAQARESALMLLRNRLERKLTGLNPLLHLGGLIKSRAPRFDWLGADDCVVVEQMTGYRMTYRTACIKQVGFNEAFSGYSLCEDIDASFSMAAFGVLIGARRARVYHHKFPARRANGRALGVMSIANRAYVVAKHAIDAGLSADEAREARRKMRAYARIRLLSALMGARDRFGRDQVRGMFAAMSRMNEILEAPRDELDARYLAVSTAAAG